MQARKKLSSFAFYVNFVRVFTYSLTEKSDIRVFTCQSTQLPYIRTCQNREIGKRVLGGLWAFSQESPDTNTEDWIPFPKRLTAHLLRARHLSTTGRAAPRVSRTKARMGPDGGCRYVEAAGHARAMGPASAAAAAARRGRG